MNSNLENNIKSNAKNYLEALQNLNSTESLFDKSWWHGKIMDWTLQKPEFKTKMFHFIDVLPSLKSSKSVLKIFREYFEDENGKLPLLFQTGLGLSSLAPALAAKAIRKNISDMAELFITGETCEKAFVKLEAKRKKNIALTFDLLGEAVLSEKEASEYQSRYVEITKKLIVNTQSWENNSQLFENHLGPLPKVNVSIKISAFYSQIKTEAWNESLEMVKQKVRPLFQLAVDNFVFLNIDMEDYALKDFTLTLFSDLIQEESFKNYPHFGLVLQAYLKDSPKDTNTLIQLAKTRGVPFTLRLVKGAYWDYEVVHAVQNNWPIPVFENKPATDSNYEELAQKLLENHHYIHVAFASHNIRSLSAALTTAHHLGLPKSALEIQMLYGMMNEYKDYFASQGYRVREYATVGEMLPGMAYLVRRLLENTANDSFLKAKFVNEDSHDKLIESPHDKSLITSSVIKRATNEFNSHPPLDFSLANSRDSLTKALTDIRQEFPLYCKPISSGRILKPCETVLVKNPSHTKEILGHVQYVNAEKCDEALKNLDKGFKSWSQTSWQHRADILNKIAELIEKDKFRLMALEILEVGKTWKEADGDICEAIDFCKYYANQALTLKNVSTPISTLGETSTLSYHPRGITAVIAPWNFPLAILTGLTVSSLVTGNVVAIKPAEQSSLIAFELARILKAAGCPEDVFALLPGKGEVVGAHLATHPLVSTIAFTGSKDVGIWLLQNTIQQAGANHEMKKCVVEMGGKNTLLVDASADLDEAVKGAVSSSFGFQGQKCSACSRILVHEECYDAFIERFVEATKSLCVDSSENPTTFTGPLIDENSLHKVQAIISEAKKQNWGHCLFEADAPNKGHFLSPTIFTNVKRDSPLFQEEFFAPLVAISKITNLEEGLEIIRQGQYALTGGIYSRSPKSLKLITKEMTVGNVYLNRNITGSIVGRHPFGGFKMSGVGFKAGGPNYLKQFTYERVVTENILRRGFSPDTNY